MTQPAPACTCVVVRIVLLLQPLGSMDEPSPAWMCVVVRIGAPFSRWGRCPSPRRRGRWCESSWWFSSAQRVDAVAGAGGDRGVDGHCVLPQPYGSRQAPLPTRMVEVVCMVVLLSCAPAPPLRVDAEVGADVVSLPGRCRLRCPREPTWSRSSPAPQPQGSMVERQPARMVVVVLMFVLRKLERCVERLRKCCLSNELNEQAGRVVPSLGPAEAGEDDGLQRRDERSVAKPSVAGEG
jgi:hypothetical protein